MRIMQRAGVVGEVLTAARGAKVMDQNPRSFHSLRHSFNSQMANAGIQEVRMKLTDTPTSP